VRRIKGREEKRKRERKKWEEKSEKRECPSQKNKT
jgi:hypothetical protein